MNGSAKNRIGIGFAGMVWLLFCASSVLFQGCSRNGSSGVFGSPYNADYRIVNGGYGRVNVEVTVRGPAAKLAVILTDPQGRSDHQIVEKEEMISNSHTIQLSMDDPKAGKYGLQVKTVDPEKVVWQKDFVFTLDNIKVEDITFHLEPRRYFMGQPTGNYSLNSIEIGVRKVGNLPVIFSDVAVAVGDVRTMMCSIEGDKVMMGEKQTVKLSLSLWSTDKMTAEERRRGWGGLPSNDAMFWPGDRYLVKGKLIYGGGQKSLDFEKELVVSEKSGAGTTTDSGRAIPALTGHVVDQASFLAGNGEAARVESAIVEMERATGGKMAVLTVPTLAGETLEPFSVRVAEQWKIGLKGEDKGALLVLVRDNHDIRLEISHGWEGAVSDACAGEIIRGMGPLFRAGRFGDGLIYAVGQVQTHVTMRGQPPPGN